MRRHLWMHGGLAVVIVGILGLKALGVAVPIGIVYLVLLACPFMMASMMLGGHDHKPRDDREQPATEDGAAPTVTTAAHSDGPHEPSGSRPAGRH